MADTYAAPDAKPKKAAPEDYADLLRDARRQFDSAFTYERENREEGIDDLRFRAGIQWPDEVAVERKESKRPMLTINRMPQFVRQVTGDIRRQRPSIKVKPVDDQSDPELAEILSDHIRHIEYVSDAQSAYITAAESAAVCGIGHFRVLTDYADDDVFEQDIKVQRILNPLSVYWDPDSVELTKEDAKWCFVTQLISKEAFERKYPEKKFVDFDGPQSAGMEFCNHWRVDEQVRIAEYWCKEPVEKTLVMLQDGRTIDKAEMTPEDRAQPIKRERKVQGHKVCCYTISGVDVLDKAEWAGKYIPIIPVIGEEVHIGERTVRHGVVRFAKDPQRLYNYWRTAGAERIALAPKQPFLLTPEQIKGQKARWDAVNTSNLPYLLYNPDRSAPGAVPQRAQPATPSAAEWQEAQIAQDDMKATTGIYDAALGQHSNETSGRAILARQQESDSGNFVYMDNLARAIRHCGKIIVDLLPSIYDTERTIRLRGEDDSEDQARINVPIMTPQGPAFGTVKQDEKGRVKILPDITRGKYDVAITVGPSYATKRLEASDSMMAFIQAYPNAAPLIGDLVAKNQDWPGSEEIAKRLRKQAVAAGVAEPDPQDGPPPQQPQAPPDPRMIEAQMKPQLEEIKGNLAIILKHMDNLKAIEVARITKGMDAGASAYAAELNAASVAYGADAQAAADMHAATVGGQADMHGAMINAAAKAQPAAQPNAPADGGAMPTGGLPPG